MRVRILGCSGGIGGPSLRTTAMLVDHDILIDVGTGVGDLSIAELVQIDHVFITHSHLDHIACLPLIGDSVGDLREKPLTVYATQPTIAILRQHIFNGSVWPDFTRIPNAERPFLRFQEIRPGQVVTLDAGSASRKITALPANHTVPAVGYHLDSGQASLVFTGDTCACEEFWQEVNDISNLRYLIVETAFADHEAELANLSMHFHAVALAAELTRLRRPAELFITHLKAGQGELIMQEIEACLGKYRPRRLESNYVFDF